MYDDVPPGFEVPLYHGPLKPQLTMGAPRDWTRMLILALAGSFLYRIWPAIPLLVFLQAGAVWGTSQDEKWFSKAWRVAQYKRYYKP